MIRKPTTSEVMDIFNNAASKTSAMQQDIQNTKTNLEKKLEILKAQNEYMLNQMMSLSEKKGSVPDKIVFTDVDKAGKYDSFGMTIHPRFTKTPRDIFNFYSTRGYIFKDNVTVQLNGLEDESLKESLKNDSIESKEFSIKEYSVSDLTIDILPNIKSPLGSLSFNMIELVPFLPGSFNIESIDVYSKDNLDIVVQSLEYGIQRVGSQRIFFSDKTEVGKIKIKLRLLYQNSRGKYPFGLKHLYVQEADVDDESYVIVRVDKTESISYIFDDVVLKSQFGTDAKISSNEYGIEYYASYDGELSQQIETSKPTSRNYISTNTRTAFIRIPLKTAMVAITPSISTET